MLKIDDSLDVFAVHGVGGILAFGGCSCPDIFSGLGLADGVSVASQFSVQAICVAITVIWTAIASYAIWC